MGITLTHELESLQGIFVGPQQIEGAIEKARADADTIEIGSAAQEEEALKFIDACRATTIMIQNFYEPLRKERHTAYISVLEEIKKYSKPLAEFAAQAKTKLTQYKKQEDAKRREREEALRKAEEERRLTQAEATGDEAILDAPLSVALPEQEEEKGRYFDYWNFSIEDTSRINPEYMIPDEKRIRELVKKQHKHAEAIVGPGIRVWCEKRPRART